MAYFGQPIGRRKVLKTTRIVFDGVGNAQISYDGGALGSSVPCNTTTWLELFTTGAMTATVNMVDIADDIGELLEIGTGGTNGAGNAPAARLMISELGGVGVIPVRVDLGTRLTIKPISGVPTVGTTIILNWFD